MNASEPAASRVSAYAPAPTDIEAPFDLLLSEPEPEPEDTEALGHPAAPGISDLGRDHWWSDRPLPADLDSEASLRCLTEAIYFEARSETETGQRAVAQVVLNRVKNPAYPDDVCAVVYQNRTWTNRCQFTFACDKVKDVVRNKNAWAMAERIALSYARDGMWLNEIGAATHYHSRRITPQWAKLMRRVKVIGGHAFYITKGGGWT